jgi:hypothetical protein
LNTEQKPINTKGEPLKMNKAKKAFVLVLVVAIVSLGLTSCKQKSEPAGSDLPAGEVVSEEHPTSEHPTKEAASEEHPAGEHPTKEAASEEHPTSEHPAGEHPK